MTDKEYELLKNKLEFLIRETDKLQQQYWDETFRRFVPPLRLTKFKSKFEIREVEDD